MPDTANLIKVHDSRDHWPWDVLVEDIQYTQFCCLARWTCCQTVFLIFVYTHGSVLPSTVARGSSFCSCQQLCKDSYLVNGRPLSPEWSSLGKKKKALTRLSVGTLEEGLQRPKIFSTCLPL